MTRGGGALLTVPGLRDPTGQTGRVEGKSRLGEKGGTVSHQVKKEGADLNGG